jgi:hypothetical protein
MSPASRDLEGERFGLLTVEGRSHSTRNNGVYWLCRCDCGNTRVAASARLGAPKGPRSCGCARPVRVRHGHARNGKHSKIYNVWLDIISRCEKPSHHAYADYGGRGIRICKRWRKDFAAFLADIGPQPSPKHSLDRKRVNGHYSQGNVRWATRVEQARNKRNNLVVMFRGRSMTFAEACEITGVRYRLAYNRFHASGWTLEEALQPGRQAWSKGRSGPPTASVAALGRACQAAGITLKDIKRIASARARNGGAA